MMRLYVMNDDVVVYTIDMLPDSLKPLCDGKPYVSSEHLDKVLSEIAINLYAVEQMKVDKPIVTPIQSYRLGITKGFPSLAAICTEFLLGVDEQKNASYIDAMHSAAKPFYPEILKSVSSNRASQAEELLKAREFACIYLKRQIEDS